MPQWNCLLQWQDMGGSGEWGPAPCQLSTTMSRIRVNGIPCSTGMHVPRGTCVTRKCVSRVTQVRKCELFHVEHPECSTRGTGQKQCLRSVQANLSPYQKLYPRSPLYPGLGLGSHLGAGRIIPTWGSVCRADGPNSISPIIDTSDCR